jgi:hypothetical protein
MLLAPPLVGIQSQGHRLVHRRLNVHLHAVLMHPHAGAAAFAPTERNDMVRAAGLRGSHRRIDGIISVEWEVFVRALRNFCAR